MAAPIGTVVTENGSLREHLTGEKPTFTKVAEGTWKHSHEEQPRSAADGPPYDAAIQELEDIVAGVSEHDNDTYSVALPEGSAA